jgi:hypothetical protein
MKPLLFGFLLIACYTLSAQNQLVIPPSLTGTTFQLNVQSGTKVLYSGTTTPTYGVDGHYWHLPLY